MSDFGDTYQFRRIIMEPFGKARPRVTANGTYMPVTYTKARAHLRQLFGPVTVLPPWSVWITAVRRMPASWSKAKRARTAGQWCQTKPDVDNIIGAVLDSLFTEDAAVVSVAGRKVWGDVAAIEIVIRTAESPDSC